MSEPSEQAGPDRLAELRTHIEIARRPVPPAFSPEALEARLAAGEPFPVVDGSCCTFAYRGPAIAVRLVHFGVGLPDDLRFERIGGWGDEDDEDADGAEPWWVLALDFPPGARLEYKLEVTDSFGTRLIEDPLNDKAASHPFGANSVCEADGYREPWWVLERPDVPRGSIRDVSFDSDALGRTAHASVYLPAGVGAVPTEPYPLVVVHDGGDYLRYAAASTVLDNLIDDGSIPPVIGVFVHPGERLVEYADDGRHHAFLASELIPRLEGELPIGRDPATRCLVGASFGAVAALSAAADRPGTYGRLLLQSGSFAGAGTGCWPRPEPLWRPIKRFVHRYLAAPSAVAERVFVSCGVFESLICENRGLVPVLRSTGMDVTFDEAMDGHNWVSWRDRLGTALGTLLS